MFFHQTHRPVISQLQRQGQGEQVDKLQPIKSYILWKLMTPTITGPTHKVDKVDKIDNVEKMDKDKGDYLDEVDE